MRRHGRARTLFNKMKKDGVAKTLARKATKKGRAIIRLEEQIEECKSNRHLVAGLSEKAEKKATSPPEIGLTPF